MLRSCWFLVLLLSALAVAQQPASESVRHSTEIPSIVGRWDSQLLPESGKGDAVTFTIAIQVVERDLRADLLNGPSRIAFTKVDWQDPSLTLYLAQYDGIIAAHCADKDCNTLAGDYTRPRGKTTVRFKFAAQRHPIELQHTPVAWTWPTMTGNWIFNFDLPETDNGRRASARFTQGSSEGTDNGGADADVTGTIAPVDGDLGLLHGSTVVEIDKKNSKMPRFTLTRFDGIHAIFLKGVFQPDGSMVGTITFSFGAPTAFRAVRATPAPQATGTAALPNPETLTRVKDANEPFRFSGIDLATGKTITQDDPSLRGKAVIVDVFGTWCPNCHDEAPLLADLFNRYRAKGLVIVGLSYEYTDDRARSARLLKLYRETYNIEFPLLLAGTTDSGQIEKTLPQLVNFGAYPTTIFLDRQGHVIGIHAGFAGPATGSFAEVKARFEDLVQQMLK